MTSSVVRLDTMMSNNGTFITKSKRSNCKKNVDANIVILLGLTFFVTIIVLKPNQF